MNMKATPYIRKRVILAPNPYLYIFYTPMHMNLMHNMGAGRGQLLDNLQGNKNEEWLRA
jgi:hypothetical protein